MNWFISWAGAPLTGCSLYVPLCGTINFTLHTQFKILLCLFSVEIYSTTGCISIRQYLMVEHIQLINIYDAAKKSMFNNLFMQTSNKTFPFIFVRVPSLWYKLFYIEKSKFRHIWLKCFFNTLKLNIALFYSLSYLHVSHYCARMAKIRQYTLTQFKISKTWFQLKKLFFTKLLSRTV